jgi:hypothetical protein
MKAIIYLFGFIILLIAASPSGLEAQVPRTFSLQGILTDTDGKPLPDGSHQLRVTLYSQSSGGGGIYSEIQATTLKDGVFSLAVGSVTPIPGTMVFDRQYYAGISVDGAADLSPRTPLTAVPYALNAVRAEQAAALAPGVTGVVTTVNGADGDVTLVGGGTTTVTRSGQSILISSAGGSGSGIAGLQNTDGTIAVQNPNGPVATIGVTPGSITSTQLADNAVSESKLANASVSAAKIVRGTISLDKLSPAGAQAGQVPTFNGSAIAWTTPQAGGGLTLPYTGTTVSPAPAFKITNTSGTGIEVKADGSADALIVTGGVGPSNAITATAHTAIGCKATSISSTGVWGQSTSSRGVYGASTSGDGVVGFSKDGNGVSASSQNGDAIVAVSSKFRDAIVGVSTNGNALNATCSGSGHALEAIQSGTGHAVVVRQTGTGWGIMNTVESGLGIYCTSTSGIGMKVASFSNIGLEALSSSGDIIHGTQIQGIGTDIRFRVLNNGNVRCDGAFTGGGADLAEAFDFEGAREHYEPGDVLVISADSDAKITLSNTPYSHMVVGVYATKPGVLLAHTAAEDDISSLIPVGVVGVVPTKVCIENGPIRRGDLLTTSSTSGHAMKVHPVITNGIPSFPSGIILGKALENFDGPGTGLIRVFVNSK